MLCQFLLYNKVNQLCVYIYSLLFKFHSHLDHHRVLNRVLWCYSTGSHQISILYIVVYICKGFSIFEFNSVQINHFYLSVEISINHYYLTLKFFNIGPVCPCRPVLQCTCALEAWPGQTARQDSLDLWVCVVTVQQERLEQKRRQEERELWDCPEYITLQASFAFLNWIETQILCSYFFYRMFYSKLPLID